MLRIVTKAGHELEVTADHLVWKSTDEQGYEGNVRSRRLN